MRRALLVGAWTSGTVIGALALVAWATAAPSVPQERAEPEPSPQALGPIDVTSLTAAATTLRDRNPFRLQRRPATRRVNPFEVVQAAPPPTPATPRPTLSLAGILGGPPWHAVIEGVPGREGGTLLGIGEEANGIRLEQIRRDTVVLAGLDTTWILIPRRAWQ